MKIRTLLLDFANSVTTDTFRQSDLLEFCSSKSDLQEVLAYLARYAKEAVVSEAPIEYMTAKFIDTFESYVTDESETELPKDVSTEKLEYHIIDGRADPNQPNIIKTRSYKDLEEILDARYPLNIYLSGETGLGKTTAVIAIAKDIGKPVVRVNISGATDLDDLMGGVRIIDGNTVFDAGPVTIAMELGAILLLDEVDAGNPKILIDLHPVLEKKGVLIKKARKMVYPSKGFQVIATGNSKGQGDVSGRYIGVAPMNHAFMQRFGAAIEFKPPNESEMSQILKDAYPEMSANLRLNLAKWFYHVYTSFENGAISEYIHVRKMLDIGMTCLIFGATSCGDTSVPRAISRAMSLYDEALVGSFVALFETIRDFDLDEEDEEQVQVNKIDEPVRIDENDDGIPF